MSATNSIAHCLDESVWMPYATSVFANTVGGQREDYQLEALLAVRGALGSTNEADRHHAHVARRCKCSAIDMLRARCRRDRQERAWREGTHTSESHAPRETSEASAVRGILASHHPAMLRYMVGDMSDKVAAECIGIKPSALRNRVNRLREKHRAA